MPLLFLFTHLLILPQLGFYYTQLKRYFDIFDRSQIKIYLFEDLVADPVGILQDIFRFLKVDEKFLPNLTLKYNVSGLPINKAFHSFLIQCHPIKAILKPFIPKRARQNLLIKLIKTNLKPPPPLPLEIRRQLTEEYKEDILKVQNLIQRDLSRWLE